MLQRSAMGIGPSLAPPIVHEVLRSPGHPLDSHTRAFFEPRFGHDFSRVRVHTDTRSTVSARAVNALAYTVGSQIVFSRDQYQPGTASGRQLLAHELTHVVQQRDEPSSASTLRVGPTADVYEREAEQAASALAMGGAPASVQRGSGLVQRQAGGPALSANVSDKSAAPVSRGTPKPEFCAAPADLGCRPTKAPVVGASKTIQFDLDKSLLTKHSLGQIHDAAQEWQNSGASGDVRVDGYASADGECVHNWRLSCRRAQAVASELASPADGSRGVSASHIAAYAHGESDEAGSALPPNRRATITLPIKPPEPKPEPLPPVCIPGPGITNSTCSAYLSNSWWLPLAYVNNATCACQSTPNVATANCVRKQLQDKLAATPVWLKRLATSWKALEMNPVTYPEYQTLVQSVLTPRIYADHVSAYRSCCCPSGPAAYPDWIGVTTVPIQPCSLVGWFIKRFGSCSGTPGTW